MNKMQTIAEFKKRIETQNFTVSRIKNIVSMKKHRRCLWTRRELWRIFLLKRYKFI